MKRVLISFSQERSRELALVLRSWLPDVIQQVQPWVSHEDIEKGQRWAAEISRHLDGSTEGLICVTPENQAKPWLNFEAGALAVRDRRLSLRSRAGRTDRWGRAELRG
uniref:TIR domain-containing protein n=1 Tax=Paractinoplanes polyasparticus TaxID=2856853 RepID=UPI001C84E834